MGTIIKRGEAYRAVIRKTGHKTLTKTFHNKALAQRWVRETEYAIERKKIPGEGDLGEIIKRYTDEVYLTKPRSRTVIGHLRRFQKELYGVRIAEMDANWWLTWARKLTCSPVSRVRYFTLITSAMSAADTLWHVDCMWSDVHRAKKMLYKMGLFGESKARDRRITAEQIEAIKKAYRGVLPFSDIVDIAVGLGLREAEVVRLQWADLDEDKKMILVRDRKHPREKFGNHQWIPLLGPAFDIVKRQPKRKKKNGEIEPRIFPWQEGTIGAAFRRARIAVGVEGVRLHDLRHEATSRLFEAGYAPQEVSLVTGHRDWNMLRRYTHLRPEQLHDGPLRAKEKPGEQPG